MSEKFRPKLRNHSYPPFKNGMYIEEYFFYNWPQILNKCCHYIPIFWQNVYCANRDKTHAPIDYKNISSKELEEVVNIECKIAKDNNMIPFTICQWDDNIEIPKPDNLVVFSAGTSTDIPLPLIVEDKQFRLERLERIPFKNKTYLCSFVGCATHPLRKYIEKVYSSIPEYKIVVHSNWQVNVDKDRMNEFVTITQQSKFMLAPRGYGPSSFRFFEAILAGVIPVYIHDGDNALPYQDEIDYSKFAIVMHMKDIGNLDKIMRTITEQQYKIMIDEMNNVKHYFTMEGIRQYVFRRLMKMCKGTETMDVLQQVSQELEQRSIDIKNENTPSSVCTIVTKACAHEAVIMIETFYLHHSLLTNMYVMCDTYSKQYIEKRCNCKNIKFFVRLDKYSELNRETMEKQKIWCNFMLEKLSVIDIAFDSGEKDTILLDSDIILLDTINDIDFSKELGVSPGYIPQDLAKRFGYYNGGFIWINNKLGTGKVITNKWREHTNKPSNMFFEQSSITDIAREFSKFEFNELHNIQYYRYHQNSKSNLNSFTMQDDNRYILYNNKIVKSLHLHLNEDNEYVKKWKSQLMLIKRIASIIGNE